MTTSSGVIDALYSFASGFNEEPCTSPGEMLAAAEASCMSLMFAQELARNGIRPDVIETSAALKLEDVQSQWTITEIHLEVSIHASGLRNEQLETIAETARERCPITRALNAKVIVKATLQQESLHAMAR